MRQDEGELLTERELAKLEKRIRQEYGAAQKELADTITQYFEDFAVRDEKMKKLIGTEQNGKTWTEADYQQWRLAQIGRGERFKALQRRIAERYTNARETAESYVNDATPGIYSLNRNYAAYTIEQVAGDVGFDFWDEQTVRRLLVEQPELMPHYPEKRAIKRGIDLAYGQKQIAASVTSGILQGKSLKAMADDLQERIPEMSRNSALRAARTAVTGAQNAGRTDSYAAAEKMGVKTKRKWVATLDNRTRHEHGELDGQVVAVDEPFEVGGYSLMFPGDPSGPPHLIYNCRCRITAVVEGHAQGGQRRARDPETGRNVLIENMSYAEWAGWKEKTSGHIIPEFTPAKTIEEAKNTANALGVKYAEFEKMSLEYANNAIFAVKTLPKDCIPKVIANGKDISTITGRPLGRKADQWFGVTYDYRQFSLRTMQLGYDKTDYDGGLIVGLNTQKYKTIDSLTKAKELTNAKYFEKTGRYWSFNTDGKATALHEIGHCYANVRGLPKNWESAAKKWENESKCDLLKNPDEAFAEAWAAYYLNDKRLPEYITSIIKELI